MYSLHLLGYHIHKKGVGIALSRKGKHHTNTCFLLLLGNYTKDPFFQCISTNRITSEEDVESDHQGEYAHDIEDKSFYVAIKQWVKNQWAHAHCIDDICYAVAELQAEKNTYANEADGQYAAQ